MGEQMLSATQVTDLVKTAVGEAIKAANTVDPSDRPGTSGTVTAPAYNRNQYAPPRLGLAMKGLYSGFRQSQSFERDVTQAAGELFGYASAGADSDPDPFITEVGAAKSERSIVWPKSREEMVDVLYAMGERHTAKSIERVDSAIKAMAEGTAGTSGLVPTQYAQDKFAYALVSTTAVRAAGITSMPVVSNLVNLPKETTAAGASTALEAGNLTAQDATLGTQTITIRKQYGYRQYSNELLADATPAWMEFLANTLVRDVALKQDQQFLAGSASGSEIQGLIGYGSITAGPSLGTNGATPSFDNLYDMVYGLRAVNAEPDFFIAHPRVLNSLYKIKDSTGNYLMSSANGVNAPHYAGTGLAGSPPKAFILGFIPTWFSSQLSIALTVGGSTDCTTAIMGAKDQVLILERQGIEVAYSEHIAFANDQSAARAIGRAAIAILQPSAVSTLLGVRP